MITIQKVDTKQAKERKEVDALSSLRIFGLNIKKEPLYLKVVGKISSTHFMS